MARKDFTTENFVVAWQTSTTLAEVVEKLGTKKTRSEISMYASYLRARGVPLKSYSRGSHPAHDYQRLSALALKAGK